MNYHETSNILRTRKDRQIDGKTEFFCNVEELTFLITIEIEAKEALGNRPCIRIIVIKFQN